MTFDWSATFMPPELDGDTLGECLDLLVKWNVRFLEQYDIPQLYNTNLRYLPERRGEEVWRSIPHVIANGGSVCHSLSAWRAAELIHAGIPARPIWSEDELADGSVLYHVRVYVPETHIMPAHIDDPSMTLGMDDPETQELAQSLWQ